MITKITGGKVYDPINRLNGKCLDLWIEGGKIVRVGEAPDLSPDRVIDAGNCIVMAGGIDIHSHIAGGKVNLGRKLRPEDHRKDVVPRSETTRSGVGYSIPSTFVTGYRYAQMGYTTVMEAAMPPLSAKHTHEELHDIPMLDKGAYTLMGNNHFLLSFIQKGDIEKARAFVSWLLKVTRGYTVKIVNPCGVESWKWGKNVHDLDQRAIDYDVTPRKVISSLSRIADDLRLPHSIHLHCNNIGTPGNYEVTIESMKAAGGNRVHITHAQFNSYGGKSWGDIHSKAPEVVDYVNKNPNVTFDIGQIVFGDTTTMTADGPWQYRLHLLSGNKWINADVEMETSAGVVPYTFRKKSLVNAVQWAIGLELILLADDLWRAFMTTDHPNGGPFTFYPQIIKLLMNKAFREEMVSQLPKKVLERINLPQITREFSLFEIAIITRAAPSKLLGLHQKGHLGVGADADIAIYEENPDVEKMFSSVKFLLKDGDLVIENGKILKSVPGRILYVDPGEEGEIENLIRDDFEKFYTLNLENYRVPDNYMERGECVPCG
ncbi:MAG: formylmethanofuran dehydrogenase subunit A [Caldiserica bacterium]|jgi:formylmethanofuran dehydrogenase subunit A|nr:formylmethanofuran dehydrogenase subunit A [Caldisericota bacterium]MDH7562014.1 formylmethanofuran dehydrogenase subunit A [Caldisericota bacterium]